MREPIRQCGKINLGKLLGERVKLHRLDLLGNAAYAVRNAAKKENNGKHYCRQQRGGNARP